MTAKILLRLMPLALAGLVNALPANSALADTPAPAPSSQNNGVYVENTSSAAPGLLTNDITVSLGGYIVGTDVKANLNGHTVDAGKPIDFSQTLGTGGNFNRIRADALWRINPKHHIRFLYFNTDVTRTRTLDKPLDWGDYQFQANASLSATTKLSVYELSYEYAFMRRPTFELAGNVGVHLLDMSVKLSGVATITGANGNVSSASYSTSNRSVPAPLPVVGLHGIWAVVPNVYLEAEGQIFKFDYQGINGNWNDLRLSGTWMFSRHFGAGLGYDRFHVNVDVNKGQFAGNVTLGYSGLQLFLTGSY